VVDSSQINKDDRITILDKDYKKHIRKFNDIDFFKDPKTVQEEAAGIKPKEEPKYPIYSKDK